MISFLYYIFVFLVSIPVAIWILASIFSLIDDTDVAHSILRISLRFLALLVLIYFAGREASSAIGYAFAIVIVFHLTFFWIIRWMIARGTLETESID